MVLGKGKGLALRLRPEPDAPMRQTGRRIKDDADGDEAQADENSGERAEWPGDPVLQVKRIMLAAAGSGQRAARQQRRGPCALSSSWTRRRRR